MNEKEYPEAELMPQNIAAVEQMERAQIDVQIATAKKYPRSIAGVKKEMLSMATMDVETAESCFYNLPRGGKSIPGPSIRLAEIALSCFGNVRAATRIIGSNLTDDPHVVIQAVCHDLEKNSAVCIEKRRRITKKKSKDKIDEDDINLATNACSAIALRDAIFKIVPGVLVKQAYDAAKQVAIGDASTLVDRRARAIDSFAKMGIASERICAALGIKGTDDITLEHLEALTGMRTAIKEGQTTIDQVFPPTPPKTTGGMFGAKTAPDKTDDVPYDSPAPQETKPTRARKQSPAPAEDTQGAGQPAAQTAPAPKSELETDKTRLAAWMQERKIGWAQLQPIVAQNIGAWAEEKATFEELNIPQCKAILAAKGGIEDELNKAAA